MNIAPKTAGATAAGSLSVAFVSILEWILGFWHISLTATAAASFATVFAFLGSYFSPRSQPTQEQIDQIRNGQPTPTVDTPK